MPLIFPRDFDWIGAEAGEDLQLPEGAVVKVAWFSHTDRREDSGVRVPVFLVKGRSDELARLRVGESVLRCSDGTTLRVAEITRDRWGLSSVRLSIEE